MRPAIYALTVAWSALPLYAQKPAEHIALGVKAYEAIKPDEALQHFQAALAVDSTNYDANCRAARAALDLAQQNRSAPDSLFNLAERYARRAVTTDPNGAQGHYLVAATVGMHAHSGNARGKYGAGKLPQLFAKVRESMVEAQSAIKLDAKQDGAHRILGFWDANIAGLPDDQRESADGVLGEELANEASWDNAIQHLEQAVSLAPNTIANHMVLAQVYKIREQGDQARTHFLKVDSLPIKTIGDSATKERAKQMVRSLPAK